MIDINYLWYYIYIQLYFIYNKHLKDSFNILMEESKDENLKYK